MEFIRKKLRKGLDIPSTPPAPKLAVKPLPDIEHSEELDIVVHLKGEKDTDEGSFESDYLPSPTSPISRKRTDSLSPSRSPTPQGRCASRSSSSSYPHAPDILAPTPRWKVGETLREDGWRLGSTRPDIERPKTARPTGEKDRPTLPKTRRFSESRTPHSTSTPPTSPLREKARHSHRVAVEEKDVPSDAKHRRRVSSNTSRPPTTVPSTVRTTERSLTPQPGSGKPLKGILKSTRKIDPSDPIYLHWQLLPYDPARCKKKLFFDISQRVAAIRDYSRMPPLALGSSDLDKPAASITLTQMTIQCMDLPHWNIVIKQSSGITCRDVFQAIHDSLNTRLTDSERELYVTEQRLAGVQKAFDKRCRDAPELDEYVRRRGMMRVDLLEGKRIFMGLCRLPDNDDCWVLYLGNPQLRA